MKTKTTMTIRMIKAPIDRLDRYCEFRAGLELHAAFGPLVKYRPKKDEQPPEAANMLGRAKAGKCLTDALEVHRVINNVPTLKELQEMKEEQARDGANYVGVVSVPDEPLPPPVPKFII